MVHDHLSDAIVAEPYLWLEEHLGENSNDSFKWRTRGGKAEANNSDLNRIVSESVFLSTQCSWNRGIAQALWIREK